MKKKICIWQSAGVVFASLFGVLLHFLYELTGESKAAALISAVNESTFEHMKLIFFPLFIFAVVQRFFFKEYRNFWCIKLAGILIGLISVPVLFYTYNGAVCKSGAVVNIGIFLLSVIISFITEARLMKKKMSGCKYPAISFAAIFLIGIMFMIFTFFPPDILLFKDPLTGTYGI